MKFSPFFGTAKIRLLCRICKFFAILFAPGLKSAFFLPRSGEKSVLLGFKKTAGESPSGLEDKKTDVC